MTSGVKFEKIYAEREITQHTKPTLQHEIWDYILYFLRVFIIVSIVFTLIRTFVFYSIGIDGQSMFPTLQDQQVVYLDLLTPRFSEYRRGDIVVLRPPQDIYEEEQKLYIKRVVGLPGETVALENGKVSIINDNYPSGIALEEEDYLDGTVPTYKRVRQAGPAFIEDKLENKEYYVLGDNRTQSRDSRDFEEVEKSRILGKVFFVAGTSDNSGFFELPTYNINN